MILVRVRDLIKDLGDNINRRLDDIDTKLDDRVTKGVFSALRSDLDNALRRLGILEDQVLTDASRRTGVWWTLGKLGAVAYALTMTALAIWGLTQ